MSITQQPSDQEHPDFCITCAVHRINGGAREYFAQTPLHPTEDDLSFGEELGNMLRYIHAMLYTLGYHDVGAEEARDLAQCGVDVVDEAQRRLDLFRHAADIWWQRYDELQKKLGRKEV